MADKITDLKSKFSTGKIPSETDFAELIDLAGCGNKALGLDDDQISASATDGLTIENKQLKVNLAENSGLKKYDDGGLGIVAGKGVKVDQNGVSLNISTQGGIDISPENVMYIKPWPGIAVSDSGELSVNVGSGLKIESSIINLNIGDGLELKNDDSKLVAEPAVKQAVKLAVKLAKDSALHAGTDGLKINVSTDSKDKNIAINEQGELTLTEKAIEALQEGSKTKFLKALDDTQKEAKKNKLIDSEFDIKTDKLNDWEDPIIKLVSQANSYGQNEVFRARRDLEKQIKEFLKDKALVKELPGYDSRRLNFSLIATKSLGFLVYGSGVDEYFGLHSVHQFKTKGNVLTADAFPIKSFYAPNYDNFQAEGFYALIGNLSANDKLGKDEYIGDSPAYITANAIMVHISKNETTTVGFWDLVSKAAPEWYQNEADPAMTEGNKDGAPFPMNRNATVFPGVEPAYSIDDQNKKIAARSQNTSPIIYSSNNTNLFEVDSTNGTLKLNSWGSKAGVTVSQAATHIHNAVNAIFHFNIKPRGNNYIECDIKEKFCHIGNVLTFKTTGGNLENNESIKFHYIVEDPNILTVVEHADHSTYIEPQSPGKTQIHIYQEKNNYYDVNESVIDFEIIERYVPPEPVENNLSFDLHAHMVLSANGTSAKYYIEVVNVKNGSGEDLQLDKTTINKEHPMIIEDNNHLRGVKREFTKSDKSKQDFTIIYTIPSYGVPDDVTIVISQPASYKMKGAVLTKNCNFT